MNREQKAAVIDEIAEEIGGSDAIFALDYRGITVAQIAELRDKLRQTETRLRVTKNSLSERAADQAGVADIKPLLTGPTALALVKGDAAAAAKVLSDTARVLRGPLAFKGGFMGGAMLSPEQVDTIAKLPSRDVLNAQLVGTIAAPLSGLARTLNALIQGVAIQLGQIRDQGLVSGTSAPADETASATADETASATADETASATADETASATADAPSADGTPESASEAPAAAEAPDASATADASSADGTPESASEAPAAAEAESTPAAPEATEAEAEAATTAADEDAEAPADPAASDEPAAEVEDAAAPEAAEATEADTAADAAPEN